MLDGKTIKEQLKALGIGGFARYSNAQVLGGVIDDNEHIKAIVTGFYGAGGGVLVATDSRLLFIRQTISKSVTEFQFDKITSVEYKEGPFGDSITLAVASEKKTITKVPLKKAQPFCRIVRELIG